MSSTKTQSEDHYRST